MLIQLSYVSVPWIGMRAVAIADLRPLLLGYGLLTMLPHGILLMSIY